MSPQNEFTAAIRCCPTHETETALSNMEHLRKVEDVFVTEGVPQVTFVKPPNYLALLVDIRRAGKPVIIEGQSGTGKTTAVKKVLSEIYPAETPRVLTPRNPNDLKIIESISEDSGQQIFIIDDFHRLKN